MAASHMQQPFTAATSSAGAPPDELDLFRGTFLPNDEHARFEQLLHTVFKHRYTTFVTVYMELAKAAPDLCEATGFSTSAMELIGAPLDLRMDTISDPAFQAWLQLTMIELRGLLTGANVDMERLRTRLLAFIGMRRRVEARAWLPLDGTPIRVQRFSLDPSIMSMTPPSYEFPSNEDQRRNLESAGHSPAFFKDVVAVALDRIRTTWPECYHRLIRLVKVIGYLPDASFRSCSAHRYTGVIYLAAKDDSLLELEESLVHEGGHQLLYNLMEVSPIVKEDTPPDEQYTLPWSGRQRNFYGYFHAFYIYILLAKYYERVHGRSEKDQQRARARLGAIVAGLLRSLPDFEHSGHFTAEGRALFLNLARNVRALGQEHADLANSTPSPATSQHITGTD